MPRGFRLTGRQLEVTGAWSAGTRTAVRVTRARGLVLNHALGFEETSLDLLEELAGSRLRMLDVLAPGVRDVAGVYALAPRLEKLRLQTWQRPVVDLARFPRLRLFHGSWRQVRDSITAAPQLETLIVDDYDEEDLRPLAGNPALTGINVIGGRRFTSLAGLEDHPDVWRLEASGSRHLADIGAVTALPGLRQLELEGCRSLADVSPVARCTSLEELNLAACGPIPSVVPWAGLTRLRSLSLHGRTVVEDGDLQPLFDLPELRAVSLDPRRHYRPPAKELFAHTQARGLYRGRTSWWWLPGDKPGDF